MSDDERASLRTKLATLQARHYSLIADIESSFEHELKTPDTFVRNLKDADKERMLIETAADLKTLVVLFMESSLKWNRDTDRITQEFDRACRATLKKFKNLMDNLIEIHETVSALYSNQ